MLNNPAFPKNSIKLSKRKISLLVLGFSLYTFLVYLITVSIASFTASYPSWISFLPCSSRLSLCLLLPRLLEPDLLAEDLAEVVDLLLLSLLLLPLLVLLPPLAEEEELLLERDPVAEDALLAPAVALAAEVLFLAVPVLLLPAAALRAEPVRAEEDEADFFAAVPVEEEADLPRELVPEADLLPEEVLLLLAVAFLALVPDALLVEADFFAVVPVEADLPLWLPEEDADFLAPVDALEEVLLFLWAVASPLFLPADAFFAAVEPDAVDLCDAELLLPEAEEEPDDLRVLVPVLEPDERRAVAVALA